MQQASIAYKSSFINYYIFGNGEKILFCLHGYGEDGKTFEFLEKHLGNIYTLYAIDFPVHGCTKWNEKKPFTTPDLFAIMQNIQQDQTKKISLLAYSMGGRAALDVLENYADYIERVALIAPDGLFQNIWYWITTQTAFGNKAFDYTMNNPGWFFYLVKVSGRLKIINKSVVKFVHHYLDNKEQRLLLYKRWTCMRKVKPDLLHVKKICAEKNIHLNFLFGKYDRIILSKRATIFNYAKNITIKIIESGHQLLREKHAKYIVALLND